MGKPISEAIVFKRLPMVFKYTYLCPYFNAKGKCCYRKSEINATATKTFSSWPLELFHGDKNLGYSKTKENFMIEITAFPTAGSGND